MRYGEERTMTEIAETVGVSQPAVTKRLQSAIGRLKRRAGREGWLGAFLPFSFAKVIAGAPKAAAGGLLLAAGGIASACAFWLTDPDTHLVARIDQLVGTTMVAALDTPLDAGENTIWCASAPLAWAALEKFLGGDVAMGDAPAWVEALNRSAVGAADVDPTAFVAGAGRISDGVVESLQARVRETFGHGRDPVLDEFARRLPRDGLIAYSFLAKDLEFPEPFDRLPHGLDFTVVRDGARSERGPEGTEKPFRVRAFGLKEFDARKSRHEKIAKHVRIHGYESRERFVVVLESKGASDDVILARLAPGKTLHATVVAALAKLALDPERLAHDDKLAVPLFDYHLSRTYDDIAGKRVLNPGFEGALVEGAIQTVRFRMNEQGVKLRSRWALGVESMAVPQKKFLLFDGPFLVLLKENRATNPYFAMWVANPEVLVPQE